MEKNISSLVVVSAIFALLLGGVLGALVGYQVAPSEKVITNEVVKEVPVETIVEKEVQVNVADTSMLLDDALKEFLKELKDNDLVCDGNEYDERQVEVSKILDGYNIYVDDDETEVSFDVKMKYLDTDVDDKCYKTFSPVVLFEEDEDPEVSY